MNPVLVNVLRGGTVESFHRGALAIVDAEGALHTALGDIERPVFPRSAVKALQALPLVASGSADRWGLGDESLALACASHGGEPAHTRTAAATLAAAGLDESALECGTHWPSNEAASRALAAAGTAPGPLHNNCSGKHAGFLCVGCLMARQAGREPAEYVRGYLKPDHPVMKEISAALAAATGCDLARAPFMVGGTGRFDTRVMQHFGERVFCKVGAEGVYCAALPDRGLGVAIKIDDGQGARAAEVAMAAVLEALARRDQADAEVLRDLVRVPLRNWNGIEVGSMRPAEGLRVG